jgi:cephalosporin hydroxylase
MSNDEQLEELTKSWFKRASSYEYDYHFRWLGRPIIQYPQDMVAMQEIIWNVQPDLIIETGVARGGSTVFYASMMELLGGDGEVVSIEIDHREYNKQALDDHPMNDRFRVIEGSSTDDTIATEVEELAEDAETVLVALDSHHTHDHVRREIDLYAPLVTKGSYLVVFDGIVEEMPPEFTDNKPWGPGNNPKTATQEFLAETERFEIYQEMDKKLLISVAPSGYLRCTQKNE